MPSSTVAENVAKARASLDELVIQAERRGDMQGWPTICKVRSLRQNFDAWAKSSGADVRRPSPDTFESRFSGKPVLMTIKTQLSSYNMDVRALIMDFRQRPDDVKGSQALEATGSIEEDLRLLKRLTDF